MKLRIAAALTFLLSACGYTSQYTAPLDGRARVLWAEDHLSNNLPSYVRSKECDEAVFWVRHPNEYRDRQIAIAPMVWVPVYYGADIVVVTPGVPPLLPQPPIFSPSLTLAQAAATHAPGISNLGQGKELLVALLLISIVVLPIIDVTIAALRPESDEASADSIDQVNAYNDLVRSAGNPCVSY